MAIAFLLSVSQAAHNSESHELRRFDVSALINTLSICTLTLTARKDTCIRGVRGPMADSYGESNITHTASDRQTVSCDFREQLKKKTVNTCKKTESMVQQGKLQSFSRRCVTLFFPSLFLEKSWNATNITKY